MIQIGELIYENNFSYKVTNTNDANGHLNNANYFDYCEKARADFLKEFGWSDDIFNSIGIAQRRRKFCEATYRISLMSGDLFKVNLRLTKGEKIFFHMYFQFYKDKDLAFDAYTYDFFVDISSGHEKNIPIPDFFLRALKNYKEE